MAARALLLAVSEKVGRRAYAAAEEVGYLFALLGESLYWILFGAWQKQPVRLAAVFRDGAAVGFDAIPIVSLACFATGAMLAIQGIHTLRTFGAESQVVLGIALSVTKEFAPLITGIFVAGRSGSAIAAKIGTMQVSQEIDALRVLGINPVRYLVSPLLAALLVTLPSLTIVANLMALMGGAIYCSLELGLPISAFFERTFAVVKTDDIMEGIDKSFIFATIIAMIAATNGFSVRAGAEGVGRATTRSVVLSIIAIILTDMVFTYFVNRT